jgi:hypothetical protein
MEPQVRRISTETEPAVVRRTVINLFVRGSNFSVYSRKGDHTVAVLMTGEEKMLFDKHRLPELASALLAFYKAANETPRRE